MTKRALILYESKPPYDRILSNPKAGSSSTSLFGSSTPCPQGHAPFRILQLKSGSVSRVVPAAPLYLCLQHSYIYIYIYIHYPFSRSLPFIGELSSGRRAKLILLDSIVYAISLEEGQPEGAYASMVARVGACLRTYYRKVSNTVQEKRWSIPRKCFSPGTLQKNHLDFRHTGINSHLFWDL